MSLKNFSPASCFGKMFPDCSQATEAEICAESAPRWQNAIISAASGLWTASTSVCHSEDGVYSECSLEMILEPDAHPKYWLSPKAAQGILRRAAKRKRTLPPHLEAALTALAAMAQDEEEKTIPTSS